MTIAWEIKNVCSNGRISAPDFVQSKMPALLGRYRGAADHAFGNRARALDAALQKLRPHPTNASPMQSVPLRTLGLV